jgi:hypothetical protein
MADELTLQSYEVDVAVHILSNASSVIGRLGGPNVNHAWNASPMP